MKRKSGLPDGNTFMEMLKDTEINLIAICRDYGERYRIVNSLEAFLTLWDIVNGEFYYNHIKRGSSKYNEDQIEALQDFMDAIWKTLAEHGIDLDRALD